MRGRRASTPCLSVAGLVRVGRGAVLDLLRVVLSDDLPVALELAGVVLALDRAALDVEVVDGADRARGERIALVRRPGRAGRRRVVDGLLHAEVADGRRDAGGGPAGVVRRKRQG